MLKRTSLFEEHQKLGGRLIDFGGWELPVQYTGVTDEHLACRNSVGLFDVSHMGEVHVEGVQAEEYLNFLVTNNVSKISVGQAQYSAMCFENGGVVDDLVIYRRAKDRFLVVVNASNTEKDFSHMKEVAKRFPNFSLSNESAKYSQIAVQGRNANALLSKLTHDPISTLKNYWFLEGKILGTSALIARTGYTGEDGFEIYVPWASAPEIWRALLQAGQEFQVKPCGLGARDTLRLEMKYPLYGNELTAETHPLEAGLSWVVKMDKKDFMGKSALEKAKTNGLTRALVGIKLLERGIPRHGYAVYHEEGNARLGELTSGTQSPMTKDSIGIAYVKSSHSQIGTKLRVDIRGNLVLAEVVATPFYKRPY
jgi:aminomethyltransferase